MTKELYNANRLTLVDAAQALIDEGKTAEIEAKTKEIEALDNQFDCEAKAQANLNALKDSHKITDIAGHGVGVVASTAPDAMQDDLFASVEYRRAFMQNVLKGTAIPARFSNVDTNTTTGDIGSVIPTTVLEQIIEKMESIGMILPLITRTSIKGGVKIPTSTVKPVATWVAEGVGSDRQKKTTAFISFAYNKLRCAVSVTLEVDTMALGVFETTLIRNVTEAMTKEVEQSIINGDGLGKPTGILHEIPVAGQEISMAGDITDIENAEAALPIAYENGAIWCMTKKTFSYYANLKDTNKQPIGRVNYGGYAMAPERAILGRPVVICDYLPTYTGTAATAGIYALLFNFKDYILNTNLNITLKRYEDNETDDQVTKAIMLVDGKVVDTGSLVTLKKVGA